MSDFVLVKTTGETVSATEFAALIASLNNRAEKVTGKSLIADTEITRLALLVAATIANIPGLQTALDAKLTATVYNALVAGSSETIASLKTLIDNQSAAHNTLNAIVTGATPDGNSVINTIQEVLAVMATFPEGVDLLNLIASKQPREDGKGLIALTEIARLLNIQSNATANQTDAYLLTRGNQFGNMPAENVTPSIDRQFVTNNEKSTWNGFVSASGGLLADTILVMWGDSHAHGTGATGTGAGASTTYGSLVVGYQTASRLNNSNFYTPVYIRSYPGYGTAKALTDVAGLLNQLNAYGHAGAVVAVMWGANDINTGDPYTTYANLVSVHTTLRAAGIATIAVPLTNRKDVQSTVNTNTNRLIVNGLLRANWRTFASEFAEYKNQPNIYADDAPDNSNYFAVNDVDNLSKVHLTDAGQACSAEEIAQAIARFYKLPLQYSAISAYPESTASTTPNSTPAAHTSGVVDDTANTFNWTANPSFTTLSDSEFSINGGTSYNTVTAKPIVVGDVALAIGQVIVRIKAATGRNASVGLTNATAFTSANVTPNAPTAPVVDDSGDVFGFTVNPTYATLADYEYTLNGGSSYAQVTINPINIGDVAKAAGQVGVRVKSATGRTVSATLYNTTAFTVALTTPAPPTSFVTDDTSNTGAWTYSAGYATAGLYEYSINGGTSWTVCTANPQPAGDNNIAVGQFLIRVKAGSGNNASAALANTVAFTAAGGLEAGESILNYTTVNTLVASGSDWLPSPYNAATTFGNTGLEPRKIASGTDGWIKMKINNSTNKFAFLGFKLTNALGGYTTHYVSVYTAYTAGQHELKTMNSGQNATNLVLTGITSFWVKLKRVGSAYTVEYSVNNTDWILARTFTTLLSTADIYILTDVRQDGKLSSPTGFGLI